MGQKDRILVVDDDPDARETLATALAQSGYVVDMAEDGRGALGRLHSWPADVLVSDVRMPGMSGLDLIRALRESGRDQPVVLITGMDVDPPMTARECGAAAFLRKPLTLEELIWAIECALACHPSGERHAVALGNEPYPVV
jgi:DNA-binding response OmpR family regulator